jgi:molecular chaperone HscB
MNHFELFNIPVSYELNKDDLQLAYLKLQKQYHPDNCESIEQQLEAVEKTILVNDAYDVLNDDVKLIQYYLKVQGLELSDKQIQENLDQDDLMYLLELQEMIADSPVKINEYKQQLKEKCSQIRLRLIQAIKADEEQAIKVNLSKLVFFNKSLKHVG